MATVEVNGIEEMKALLGREIGPTDWRTVTQADINAFAELSGDHQWIHVDAERAKTESPSAPRSPMATSPWRWSTASASS
jgi:acyl dehydratase